jgi:hypothetical protein
MGGKPAKKIWVEAAQERDSLLEHFRASFKACANQADFQRILLLMDQAELRLDAILNMPCRFQERTSIVQDQARRRLADAEAEEKRRKLAELRASGKASIIDVMRILHPEKAREMEKEYRQQKSAQTSGQPVRS